MKLLKLALVCSVFAFSAVKAEASILLEPYLKYSLGTLKSTAGPASADYDANALGIGARAGFGFSPLPLFIALDYTQNVGGTLKAKTQGASDGDNMKETQLWAVVGGDFPIVRAWLGYAFINELGADAAGGGTGTFKGGDGIKVGVGFKVIPMLSLNAEYVMSTYKKYKDNSGEHDIGSLGLSEVKGNAIVLSASVPLMF